MSAVNASDLAARQADLDRLQAEALGCVACGLAEHRTQVVFGSGDASARVMIVGEAPGQREDEQGRPFVGPSGALLEQLLGEIDLRRDEVYIGNVVKCRPPRNRDPRSDEIDACKGYLRTQLRLVDPAVVVTLGNFSSKLLLRTTTGITRLRGQAYPWWGRYLVPTFHPAAALRGSARVLEEMRHDFGLVADVVAGRVEPPPVPSPVVETEAEADAAPDTEQLGLFG